MAENKKISGLPAATEPLNDADLVEVVQGGVNKKAPKSAFGGGAVDSVNGQTGVVVLDVTTREFNRTWSSELIFDKNVIKYTPHTAIGHLTFTVAGGGHLVNQESTIVQEITVDGLQSINFTGFQYIYGITNGETPDAGTYTVFFLYINGTVWVNWAEPSSQAAAGTTLTAPPNFVAVADGENEIDLTWDDVNDESSYLIEVSSNGVSGWTTLSTPVAGSTSANQTGLGAGDTRFYRIKAVGDGVTFFDSPYSTASATTENSGDVTAPTFTFAPVSGATDVLVNQSIVITANEAIRNTDGSAITNANVATRLTLKETNSGGANIAFTATIDVSKTVITITPTAGYGGNQLVYVAINNVEDTTGNEVIVAVSNTFTTGEYTRLNGSSNYLRFGDILDTLFTINDAFFKLRITLRNIPLSGSRFLIGKYSTPDNQRSFYWYTIDSDVYFSWARTLDGASRTIKWAGVLSSSEQELELEYNGAVDSNDGLDRGTLRIGGVIQGSKSLAFTVNVLSDIVNSTAQLSFGAGVSNSGSPSLPLYFIEEAKDLQILSAGDVMEIDVPVLIEGTDVSGNARHGTWN